MLAAPSRPRRKASWPSRAALRRRSMTSMRPSGRTSAMTIRSAFAPTSIAATVVALLDSSCFSAVSMRSVFLLDDSGTALFYRAVKILEARQLTPKTFL